MRKYLIIISAVLFAGCIARGNSKYRETRYLMGTVVHIDVCQGAQSGENLKEAYRSIWNRFEDISWRMNVYDAESDVAKINHSFKESVEVGRDTYYVIEKSLEFNRLTRGAFDITVWPLIELWKEGEKKNVYPVQEQLDKVLKSVGNSNIELLPKNRVQIKHPLTRTDLGGIAKGYAIDEAARIFREKGVANFFIDAGGDIYVGGVNCKDQLWSIGIRNPIDKSGINDIVYSTDRAVATSGNYEQYYEIQGQRLSHIIHPVSGLPQKGVISATVIAPTALEADALATALTILGHPEGTRLIQSFGDGYASLIVAKNENVVTEYSSNLYKRFLSK